MTANWALAMHHSRGAIFHSFSERTKTRKSSLIAASSVGKCRLARTARRSLAFRASIAFGVEHASDVGEEGVEGHDLAPGAPPALDDGRIAVAPVPVLEGAEGGFAGRCIDGAIDALQRRDGLAVLVGDEVRM